MKRALIAIITLMVVFNLSACGILIKNSTATAGELKYTVLDGFELTDDCYCAGMDEEGNLEKGDSLVSVTYKVSSITKKHSRKAIEKLNGYGFGDLELPIDNENLKTDKVCFVADGKFVRLLAYYHIDGVYGVLDVYTEENYDDIDTSKFKEITSDTAVKVLNSIKVK